MGLRTSLFLADNGALDYYAPNGSTSLAMSDFSIALSSSTAFIEASFAVDDLGGIPIFGVQMAESSTQKALGFAVVNATAGAWAETQVFTSWTRASFVGYVAPAIKRPILVKFIFWRLRLVGSNIKAEISFDRLTWTEYRSLAITSAFTTAPDYVGIYGIGYNIQCYSRIPHLTYGSL
jgi:hypothetical protein